MTNLNKPISRVSNGFVREQGKAREIVIILEPPNVLYFRTKGCRKRYALTAEVCYTMAVKAHVRDAKKQKAKEKKAIRWVK